MTWLKTFSGAAMASLLATSLAAAAPSPDSRLSQLPLVEVTAAGRGDTFVVLFSGDGGWAGIDKGLANSFAKAGVPVVGYDSLRYFWTRRTPAEAAADLSAVLNHYSAAWRRPKVILAGYSFGAGALPAIAVRLPPEMRARVRLLALIGVETKGELQFHPGAWLNHASADAYPIAPVLASLGTMRRVCVFGDREAHDACPSFSADEIHPVRMAGGHHFSGDYAPISTAILRSAGL